MKQRTERLLALAVVAAVGGGGAGAVAAMRPTHHKPKCTHGLSSIGPVTYANGKVTGDTTPHTEACLP